MNKVLKVLGCLALGAIALIIAGGIGMFVVLKYYIPNDGWKTEKLAAYMKDGKRAHRDRWYAGSALLKKGGGSALGVLPYLLVSDAALLQELVPQSLLDAGPDAVPALIRALQDSDREAREAGAFWLGAMARACGRSEERYSPVIECRPVKTSCSGLLSEPEGGCEAWRARVRPALAAARPALAGALKDADEGVRETAAASLKDLR